MAKRDILRQEMKKAGIQDYRLERGRRVNLFALLKSLGVDNPKQTLTRFVHDEIKTNKDIQEATQQATEGTLSLGPWVEEGVLGFVNRLGYPIKISNEQFRGNATVSWRRYEGNSASLPLTIKNGGVYEVYVTNIGQSTDNVIGSRFYLAYKVEKA